MMGFLDGLMTLGKNVSGAVQDPQFWGDVGQNAQDYGIGLLSLPSKALPAAYSYGNYAKRRVNGLIADPVGSVQQMIGDMGDQGRKMNALQSVAYPMAGDNSVLVSPAQRDAARDELAQTGANNALAGVYLPHTPLNQNPLVGTRYQADFVGNMAPKTPRRIEDLQGSSLLAMPWDSTSRGYSVKAISDEVLPYPVLTTGGQDFARDLTHINQNVGGASNEEIAKRIQDRVKIAAKENSHFGGNGTVYSLPTTMGAGGENFSTMPTEALLGLIQNADLSPSQINQLNEWVRNSPVVKNKQLTRPFQNFAGIDKDAGLLQFITGEGLDTTAGELRKAFANEMQKVRGQQMLGYNKEDLVNALTDPSLMGVPKGYAGNTVIKSDPHGLLTPSDHPSYNTNFPGQYYGSLLNSIPVEHLMPKTYRTLAEELASKRGDLRTNVIGAMEKRKAGISEIVDQQVVDSVNHYLESLKR